MKEYILKEKENGEIVTVREMQLAVLDIMDEIHRVCEKNNIKYALIAGSALGILNYKGFIPWDDDIDICILREDWKRFVEALKKDLKPDFYFQSFEVDQMYFPFNPTMKIRKHGTYHEEVNTLIRNRCKSGDGVYVDVVIYDSVSENKWIHELYCLPIRILMLPAVLLHNLNLKGKTIKKIAFWWEEKYSKKQKNSEYISQTILIPWEKPFKSPSFSKKDVLPFRLYEFEGREFYSYNNIPNIVSKWYGPQCYRKDISKEWIETLPIEKRKPKHTKDINLHGETKKP